MNTKTKIFETALRLFSKHGFSSTSISAIRKEAGISNGSFFHAFPSKEDLASQLYIHTLTNYHEALVSSLSSKMSAPDGINLIIKAHLSWVVNERSQAAYLFENSHNRIVKSVHSEQQVANEKLKVVIQQWVDPLVERGALVNLPIHVFSAQLIGPSQLICRAWLAGRDSKDPRDSEDLLITAACRSLIPSMNP